MSQHTIMRRSTRIRWQIPIQITSVDPRFPFNETCETVAVNAHGCGVICHVAMEKGTPVKLGLLPDNREVMAHIADVVKLGEDGRAWLLGLQLDAPANVWGVRNPPHDWEKAGTEEEGAASAPLAAGAAAGASGSGAVATATLAAPEFSIASPAPPAKPTVAVQSVAVDEAAKAEAVKPTLANSDGVSGQHGSEAGRSNGSQRGAGYIIRDRDWSDLRKQMEEHLQDLMWQVDDQVENKLEHWKEQMVDAEARLESLCQLQDRLQAHITVLSEIVKEKVKPESPAGAGPDPAATGSSESKPAALAEDAAVTASQVEEIRQLQQWMQSLIHLLPQAVEQHANEAVGAAEQRLHGQADEQFEVLRKQLAEVQQRLDAATAAPSAEAGAVEEEKRKASQDALRAAGEEIRNSVQESLREESQKLREEFQQAHQAAQEEAERLRKLHEETAAAARERTAQAGQQAEELKAAESAVRAIGEQLRAELLGSLKAEVEAQKQQVQQAASAVESQAAQLQVKMGELTTSTEETRRARESLESVVASLTQAASQQIKEDVSAGLSRMAGETRQEAERREKEFSEKVAEAQRLGSAAQEQLAQLAKQAGELSARLEAGDRTHEALESRLEAAIAVAEKKVESNASSILREVGSHSEQQIRRLEEQVAAQQAKLDELTTQRKQELQSALDVHMATLRASSETMLRKVSEELRGSLNNHLKEEFASQRHIWEKQREASQAEKAWVETRANELAGRWEARLQGYIERATGEAVNKLRTDVERAAGEIIREQMEQVEKRLSGSLEPLLARAENSSRGLEKLLASVQGETQRAEAQDGAFQRQRDEAADWMEKQMERLRQAVHDAVVETSGEIKGRIHMAVEMAREPIEQRGREAQRQVEEMAERKSREMADRLAEFEKAMAPRLQAHLAEVMGKFQKDTEEVAHKSAQRCQDDLAETLESMLHLVRKREGKSK